MKKYTVHFKTDFELTQVSLNAQDSKEAAKIACKEVNLTYSDIAKIDNKK